MIEHQSYYSIIPADVRYDRDLTPNAKLLYAEITSLCNSSGYCWASNAYFADLYGVSKISISKWINQLVKKGYIETEIEYKEGSKEILNRYIRIVGEPIKEKLEPYIRKVSTPIKEKFKENNKHNNKHNNKKNILRHHHGEYKNVLLSDDDLLKLKSEYPNHWQQLIKSLDEGIEMRGYKYKNHLLAIRNWAKRDGIPPNQQVSVREIDADNHEGTKEFLKEMGVES